MVKKKLYAFLRLLSEVSIINGNRYNQNELVLNF